MMPLILFVTHVPVAWAIVLFSILGAAGIFGFGIFGSSVLGSRMAGTGFHNLTGLPGGFLPNGIAGLWMAVIVGSGLFLTLSERRRAAVQSIDPPAVD